MQMIIFIINQILLNSEELKTQQMMKCHKYNENTKSNTLLPFTTIKIYKIKMNFTNPLTTTKMLNILLNKLTLK